MQIAVTTQYSVQNEIFMMKMVT